MLFALRYSRHFSLFRMDYSFAYWNYLLVSFHQTRNFFTPITSTKHRLFGSCRNSNFGTSCFDLTTICRFLCMGTTLIALFLTWLPFLDIPVSWPILLGYYIIIVFVTAWNRIQHMQQHKVSLCSLCSLSTLLLVQSFCIPHQATWPNRCCSKQNICPNHKCTIGSMKKCQKCSVLSYLCLKKTCITRRFQKKKENCETDIIKNKFSGLEIQTCFHKRTIIKITMRIRRKTMHLHVADFSECSFATRNSFVPLFTWSSDFSTLWSIRSTMVP